MPLNYDKSKEAVSQNVKTEMAHGKPQKQAIAIAMSVKRKGKPAQSLKRTMVRG